MLNCLRARSGIDPEGPQLIGCLPEKSAIFSKLWCNLGLVQGILGRYWEAAASFHKALSYDRVSIVLQNALGIARFQLGAFQEAERAFAKAVQLFTCRERCSADHDEFYLVLLVDCLVLPVTSLDTPDVVEDSKGLLNPTDKPRRLETMSWELHKYRVDWNRRQANVEYAYLNGVEKKGLKYTGINDIPALFFSAPPSSLLGRHISNPFFSLPDPSLSSLSSKVAISDYSSSALKSTSRFTLPLGGYVETEYTLPPELLANEEKSPQPRPIPVGAESLTGLNPSSKPALGSCHIAFEENIRGPIYDSCGDCHFGTGPILQTQSRAEGFINDEGRVVMAGDPKVWQPRILQTGGEDVLKPHPEPVGEYVSVTGEMAGLYLEMSLEELESYRPRTHQRKETEEYRKRFLWRD